MSVKEKSGRTRAEIVEYLESHNIQTRNLFAGNILRHPCFEPYTEGIDYRVAGSLDQTDYAMQNSFWVGVYPGMTRQMLDEIVKRIKEAVC